MPTVNVGEPLKRILCVVTPAASPLPEANNNAGAEPEAEVLAVTTSSETVKSPVVLILITPEASRPLYVVAPAVIAPMVKSPELTIVSAPTDELLAMVRSALLVLDKLTALLPINTKPKLLAVASTEPVTVIVPPVPPIAEILPKVITPA